MDATRTVAVPGPVHQRDRFVDLVRAGSIVVVVLGHWLMAVVTWRSGTVSSGNLLEVVPSLQPATWLLQVMPLFFVVGGFANAGSWASTRRRGGSYADFVARRVGRLLRPVWPFLAVWVVVAAVLAWRGPTGEAARAATLVAVQPLWFVGLYVLVLACTPVMLGLHRRYGARVLVVLALVVLAVDVATRAASLDVVGYVNYAAVWLFAHQLGFFHADGRADRVGRGRLALVAVAALVCLVLLTTLGPYPTSMVGLAGERSNLSPPTFCVVVLTTWEVALVLLALPGLSRWLRRSRPWSSVVAVNSVIMTIFLWHLTALVLVAVVASRLDVPLPPVASWGWWLLRPVWLAVLSLVLLALVALLGRVERAGLGRRAPVTGAAGPSTAASLLGVVWVVLGLSGLALCGLAGLCAGRQVALLHLTMSPVVALVDVVLGAVLVRAAVTGRRRTALWGVTLACLGLAAADPVLALWAPSVQAPGSGAALSYLLTAAVLGAALLRRPGGAVTPRVPDARRGRDSAARGRREGRAAR